MSSNAFLNVFDRVAKVIFEFLAMSQLVEGGIVPHRTKGRMPSSLIDLLSSVWPCRNWPETLSPRFPGRTVMINEKLLGNLGSETELLLKVFTSPVSSSSMKMSSLPNRKAVATDACNSGCLSSSARSLSMTTSIIVGLESIHLHIGFNVHHYPIYPHLGKTLLACLLKQLAVVTFLPLYGEPGWWFLFL